MEKPHQENLHTQNKVSWEADDFYYHPKDFSWYLLALLASISLALIPWLISGRTDYITTVVILVALLGLTIYAGRKPQEKKFELTNSSLKVDNQSFDLLSFSRYWVEVFETHTQVTLVGVKRTAMPVSLCLVDRQLAKQVIAILQVNLPETNPSKNPADWLMRKIKF